MPATAAITAGAQTVNGLINQAFAEHNRKRNYYWNEKAADSADARQRAQYKDLYSPQAMLDQYAAAGLSPSMMMSGGQSAVGGTPQGSQGSIDGPYPSGPQLDPIAAAQLANINANTEKTKAETINIGADTEFTMANILKSAAETENYKEATQLLRLDQQMKQLQIIVAEATTDEQIKKAEEEVKQMLKITEKIVQENKALDWQNKFTEETYKTRVEQISAEYAETISQTALNWSNIQLNNEQIKSLAGHLAVAQWNARTQNLSVQGQLRMNYEQVQQWLKQNKFTEQEIKNEKTKIWTNFATNLLTGLGNLAKGIGSVVNAVK